MTNIIHRLFSNHLGIDIPIRGRNTRRSSTFVRRAVTVPDKTTVSLTLRPLKTPQSPGLLVEVVDQIRRVRKPRQVLRSSYFAVVNVDDAGIWLSVGM